MQISTQWQTAYYTPTVAYIDPMRRTRCNIIVTKTTVLEYLEKHGITERRTILKNLGMTKSKLGHVLSKLVGLVECEQSGSGAGRTCHYWAKSNPPRLNQRAMSFQAWDFISRTGWVYASEIPDDIIPTPRKRHMCVLNLEVSGKLTSRVHNGRKQYKAVI